MLYTKYAKFYDRIYSKKKYGAEVVFVKLVVEDLKVKGNQLLDMACGTGTHSKKFIDAGFSVTGVDASPKMLRLAKKKVKRASIVEGSMQDFKSKQKFDIVTCLFTSINYNRSISELDKTIKCFSKLLNKKGIVVFDLGLIKGKHEKKSEVMVDTYREGSLQIARIGQGRPSGGGESYKASFLMFVKDKGKVDFDIDEHNLGVFSVKKVKSIMELNGFEVRIYDGFSLEKYHKKSRRPVFVGQM